MGYTENFLPIYWAADQLIVGIPKWIGKELDELTGRIMGGRKKVQTEFVEVKNRTKGEIINRSAYPVLQEMQI